MCIRDSLSVSVGSLGGTLTETVTDTAYAIAYTAPTTGEGTLTFSIAVNSVYKSGIFNNAFSDSTSITYDTTAPTTLSITPGDTTLKSGQTTIITATFSEAVTITDGSWSDNELSLTDDTTGTLDNFSKTSDTVYTATYTPTDEINAGTSSFQVAAATLTDLHGNANTALTDAGTTTYDTLRPTITDITTTGDLREGETATITITFSCLLYTSPSPRDRTRSRMPSSA